MRHFHNIATDIIDASGQRLNRISKTSGISHTYLTKLIQGNINRPGKDKVASILLSLDYSVTEINKVLAAYDYRPLNPHDIPAILLNNRKRRIEGNMLPFYDNIHMRLLLSPFERLGGTKVLVKNMPSVLFMPNDLYLGRDATREPDPAAESFRREFAEALIRERKAIFKENLRLGCRFETYICRKCLTDYLQQHLGDGNRPDAARHRERLVRYFANMIFAHRRRPDQHLTRIIDRCAYFEFQIQCYDTRDAKVFFLGKRLHDFDDQSNQLNVLGFTSDAPATITLFRNEVDLCRQAADPELTVDYPEALIRHINAQFEPFGLRDALQQAVAQLAAHLREEF